MHLTQDTEAFRLEDLLQGREVDDQQLAHDGAQHSVAEHTVAAQAHFMHHTRLQRVGVGVKGHKGGLLTGKPLPGKLFCMLV